ncbi:breast carcinoma-amplified sequence 1 [Aplochiton taeniatus]
MATKVQTASTSGVRLLRKTAGVATTAEPKKETPAPPPAVDAAPAVKPKEEAAAAKPPEATADSDSVSGVSQSDESAANSPRKTEKRNSIHLFFKTLGQKGKSEAGVQKEPEKTQ